MFAAMQVAAIAGWLKQTPLAVSTLESQKSRIDTKISPDGSQPEELARPTSFHYSTFTLVAYARLVAVGDKLGVDLWNYVGPDGQ